jgi:hypothetical protein
MRKLFYLILLLIPFGACAQMNQEVNEIHSWLSQSEQVILGDSISNLLHEECKLKGIDEMTFNRNQIFLKALCNPKFDKPTRIRIADMIITRFQETPQKLPLDFVLLTKQRLSQHNQK